MQRRHEGDVNRRERESSTKEQLGPRRFGAGYGHKLGENFNALNPQGEFRSCEALRKRRCSAIFPVRSLENGPSGDRMGVASSPREVSQLILFSRVNKSSP